MTTVVKKLCIEFARALTKKELIATQRALLKIKGVIRVQSVTEKNHEKHWRRSGDYHYYEDDKLGYAAVTGPRNGVYVACGVIFGTLKEAKAYVESRYGPRPRRRKKTS